MEHAIYTICFFVGLLFTIFSAGFFGHLFGGGHDPHVEIGTGGHAEAGFNDTGMPGLSPFSPTAICSFLTAFGGFGIVFSTIHATSNMWVSLPLSLLGGVFIEGAVLWLFAYVFHKTRTPAKGISGGSWGRMPR